MCRRNDQSACKPVVNGFSFDLCEDCEAATGEGSCVPDEGECQRGCGIYRDQLGPINDLKAIATIGQTVARWMNSDQDARATTSMVVAIINAILEWFEAQHQQE